LLHTLT